MHVSIRHKSDFLSQWIGLTVGTGALVLAPIGLLVLGAREAAAQSDFSYILAGLIVMVGSILISVNYEFSSRAISPDWSLGLEKSLYTGMISIVIGAVMTYGLSRHVGFSVIVAASIVGILGGIVAGKYSSLVYCGAFVGMTSPSIFGSYLHVVGAAILASFVWYLSRPMFRGMGGKLGTVAFVGVIILVLSGGYSVEQHHTTGLETLYLAIIYSVVGALGTYLLHTSGKTDNVIASATVGLIGGAVLPFIHASGELLAASVFAASFAGMSTPERIPSSSWMASVGILSAVGVVYTTATKDGCGGLLGAIAFGSSLIIYGIVQLLRK